MLAVGSGSHIPGRIGYRTQKNPSFRITGMRQVSAFPIRLIHTDPANLGSADADFFGEGDNGLEYCVKTVAKTPAAPAAEYICHQLAAACGFAVAQYDIVELLDGTVAFGSVWDSSALQRQDTLLLLMDQLPGKGIQANLSRIYAFDLFVHNVDRHPGNYLCVKGRTPGHTVKVYDFSRAFTAHGWPLPALPMSATEMTVATYRQVAKAHPFVPDEAMEALDRISDVAHSSFKGIIDSVPKEWLDAPTRREVLKWWAGPRDARLKLIRKGLADGSFL